MVAFWTRIRASDEPLAIKLAAIAVRHHGVVSHRQLFWIGVSTTTISRWIDAGHLHSVHRGVYAIGHRAIQREGEWMAAVLACRRGTVLSHGPAGQLQGLIDRRDQLSPHVSLPCRTGGAPRGIVVHRPRKLEPEDCTTKLWIPTTTPTRTVWDIASTHSPKPTRRAFAQAEKWGDLDRVRLSALLSTAPSRKGSATIRELLSHRPLPLGETRSWLEDLLMQICWDHKLPLPAVNVPVLDYTVDFLWPQIRFIIEADGSDHLESAQRDGDNKRDITLARAGYLVRRYSSRAMMREAEVAREVLEILAERDALSPEATSSASS